MTMHLKWGKNIKLFVMILLALSSTTYAIELSLADENSLSMMKQLMPNENMVLHDVDLNILGSVTLNLRRFKVLADNATLTIHYDQGTRQQAMPNNIYYTGSIQGMKDSRVFIGLLENGQIEGIIESDKDTKYTLSTSDNKLKLSKPSTEALSQSDNRYFNPKDYLEIPPSEVVSNRALTKNNLSGDIDYQLTVAIETDYEFYQLFNDNGDAVNYITGLIGYISSLYYDEINTFVLLGHVSIWNNNADPWSATSTDCALYEVGKYWNDNNGNIDRAITHFMSGKNLGGGIAWKGVLCNSGFNYNISESNCNLGNDIDNYGGAYGVSASLSGSFNSNNPQPVWDIVVTSHEIGHNFDSPHTHCYGGIGGNANPVDECYSSEPNCYVGAQSLPGPSGQGSGTIMSYCHLLSPGLSNIVLSLGTNHAYGVEPIRVPNQMRTHVENVAGIAPQCVMPAANDLIFLNGFE